MNELQECALYAIRHGVTIAQLSAVGLSQRAIDMLDKDNIIYVEDFAECEKKDVLVIPNFGKTMYQNVIDAILRVREIEKSEIYLGTELDNSFRLGGVNFMGPQLEIQPD